MGLLITSTFLVLESYKKMTAQCDLGKILKAAQARQDRGALKVSAALKASTGMLGRGAQKKVTHPALPLRDLFIGLRLHL